MGNLYIEHDAKMCVTRTGEAKIYDVETYRIETNMGEMNDAK